MADNSRRCLRHVVWMASCAECAEQHQAEIEATKARLRRIAAGPRP